MLKHDYIKYTDKVNLLLITKSSMNLMRPDKPHTFIKFEFEGDLYRVHNDNMETLDAWIEGTESPWIKKLSEAEQDWFDRVEKKKFGKLK
tara:strand:- start:3549 stop:3818 length:270 start_codon:yes stop_codon:yes gene_type:complete